MLPAERFSRIPTILRGCVSTTPCRRMMLSWSRDCMTVTSWRKSVSASVCVDRLLRRDFTATVNCQGDSRDIAQQINPTKMIQSCSFFCVDWIQSRAQ